MAIRVFKSTVEPQEGLTMKCTSREKSFLLDEPSRLGGNDLGPNPVEGLLSCLGACKLIVAKLFAEASGIRLHSIRIELEGDLDLAGFTGEDPDAPVGFSAIRTVYQIEADNSKDELDRFIQMVEARCPVKASLAEAPSMSYEIH